MTDILNLKGKKILVTGAGRGIGRNLAETLHELGAVVYALSRSKGPLDELKAKCPEVHIISVDLENWDETRQAVEAIGPVDGVVNNAGILKVVPLIDSTPEYFEQSWQIMVKAVLNVSQVVAKGMIETGKGGTIVNVSSNLSRDVLPGLGVYASCKSALDRLTFSMTLEWGKHGIRANTVNPTLVETEMTLDYIQDKEALDTIVSRIPLGRHLKVDDVTKVVLFLLSDQSAMISGDNILLDGGYRCS